MNTERIVFLSSWTFVLLMLISTHFALQNVISIMQVLFIFFAVWSALVSGILIGLNHKGK